MRRFEERFGRLILHAMVGCTYDQTRVGLAGAAAADILTPGGVTHGIETLTMLPSVIGGPRTYISFGPYDHKGLKGDWLTLRRVVDGVPTFEGLLSTLYPESSPYRLEVSGAPWSGQAAARYGATCRRVCKEI